MCCWIRSFICNWFTGLNQLLVVLVGPASHEERATTLFLNFSSPGVGRIFPSLLSSCWGGCWERDAFKMDHIGTSSCTLVPLPQPFSSSSMWLYPNTSQTQRGAGSGSPGANQRCFWPWETAPPTWGTSWAGRSCTVLEKEMRLPKQAKAGQVGYPRTPQMV